MDARATKTSSTGDFRWPRFSRNVSRINRRARFRTTAPPIFRLVTTPSRDSLPSGKTSQLAIKQPCTSRWPPSFTRRNSCPSRNRADRGRPNAFGRSSAMRPRGKLYRSQALAAQITTAAEDLTAALRGITAQETMLPLAAHLRRLILAFHASVSRFKCLWRKPLCQAGKPAAPDTPP